MAAPQVLINDAVRRQVLLEGVKAAEAEKFLVYLKEIDKSLRISLTADMSDVSRARINRQVASIKKDIATIMSEYRGLLDESLQELAVSEATTEAAALNKTILESGFETAVPAPEQLISAFKTAPLSIRGNGGGMLLESFLDKYEDDQIAIIAGRISQGFAEGETADQILRSLRGTKAAGYKDGILAIVDRNTKTMIRTGLQHVSSAARQATWEANSDVIVGVEWVSTLDSSTTEQCQSLDGQIFPIDSGPRPPIHPGCRSTTAPVLPDDLQYLEKGAKRAAVGEDGIEQVSAKTSYFEWLKTQPVSFQDEVLGVTKSKLLREGGMTAQEFGKLNLGKNFKPLTIQEMARIAPEAFDKAGIDKP